MEKEIMFNGVKYRLMGGGRYYLSQSNTNAGRKGAKGLHVAVWEHYSGKPVPLGCCIHHKDGNTFNNDFQNLECVESKKHISYHSKKNLENDEYVEKNKASLIIAQEKAKEWHKSEDGLEWHKKHVSESLAKAWAFREERFCAVCGKPYIAKTARSMYCGNSCQQKASRERRKLRETQHIVSSNAL